MGRRLKRWRCRGRGRALRRRCSFHSPYRRRVTGRSDIESFWREDIGAGDGVTKLPPESSVTQGDLLHVDGIYEVASKDAVVLGRGQYQQLWRRVDGQWKVQHEIWRLDPLAQRDASMAERLQSLWMTAYNAGDAASLTALYDQNAMLSTQPSGSVMGKDAIGAFWKGDFGSAEPKTTLVLSDVYLAGDLAHLEGEYQVSEKGRTTKGHYVQLWMQSDERAGGIHARDVVAMIALPASRCALGGREAGSGAALHRTDEDAALRFRTAPCLHD